MSAAYQCNRCKKLFAGEPRRRISDYFGEGEIDLCKKCTEELNKFLKIKGRKKHG